MIKGIILFASIISLQAFDISPNDDYKVYENKNYSIIYTNENKSQAEFLSVNIDKYLLKNNNLFSYQFDEPLKISLVSNKMQIANAFSTQNPMNMTVFFNGGGSYNNYFANISWLKSLMLHELVHNYQLNAKKSKISKILNKTLGKNFAPIWAGVPFFTLPNAYLPTFMLEGNAVLNETLYENGGRLYNGNLNALKNSLIFANKIDINTLINDTLEFPYTESKYIIGGFYMQYMAQRFGVKKVNSFFYAQSIHSINPLLLNPTYKRHFGIGFERSINDFVVYTKNKYKNYHELKLNPITTSKSKIYFSNINNKIYFITSDLKTKKELWLYDFASKIVSNKNTTLDNDKLFKINNKLYATSSNMISPTDYKYGLFDSSQNILKNTQGKSIQDINGKDIAYIDINSSFNGSRLFVNDKYYSNTVSNALFDKNSNIYYFKQDGKNRTLYKNKEVIFSFEGYFTKLVNVEDDEVYFIANSENGSTLYKYTNNNIYSLSPYENIIEASIINNKKAIISTISANNYQVHEIDLHSKLSNIAIYKNVKLEDEFVFTTNKDFDINSKSKSYNSIKELQYVSSYPSMSSTVDETIYTLSSSFADPLLFNQVNMFLYKDNDDSYASVSYINSRYFINYALNYYKINRDIRSVNSRTYGGQIAVFSNLYQNANHLISTVLAKQFDDENKDDNPIIFTLNHKYSRYFALASDYNTLSDISLIYKDNDDYNIHGVKYNFTKHLFNEFYLNTNFTYLKANDQRKIEVVNDLVDINNDPTRVSMLGYDGDFYVKDMTKVSIGISKPIYISKYFSKFPFSLRKENISFKYHQYNFTTYKAFTVKEKEVNLDFDILFGHKFSFPIQFKYITNDHSEDDYKFFVNLGVSY